MAARKKRLEGKKSEERASAGAEESGGQEKVSFQLRMDEQVHTQLKNAAIEAGVSLNQLIHGILRVTSWHLVQGKAVSVSEDGERLGRLAGPRAVFFGKFRDTFMANDPAVNDEERWVKRNYWFGLDFNERADFGDNLSLPDALGMRRHAEPQSGGAP